MTECIHCKLEYADGTNLSVIMCPAGGYCEAAPLDTAPAAEPAPPHVHAGFHDPLDDDGEQDGCPWLAPVPPGARAARAAHARVRVPALREALLPFESSPERRILTAGPYRPFQPRGLLLFDLPEGLKVSATLIGSSEQLIMSCGDVPARWFAQAQTFEQLKQQLREGREPAAWGSWDFVYPGLQIRLHFSAPVGSLQAVMWGHCKC